MRKLKVLRFIGIVTGIGCMIWVFIVAQQSSSNWTVTNSDIDIEYSENQLVIDETKVQDMVETFLAQQPDSAVLDMDLQLLETSLESLPYVAEAQVYWNLNNTLAVELRAIQVRAKILMEQSKFLLTQEGAVLPAPSFAQIDLPICTGIHDSDEAAATKIALDVIDASKCYNENGIAQIHFNDTKIIITPRGTSHNVTVNRDKRLSMDLEKLAAYYAANTEEKLDAIRHLDLRFKNQVITTVQ